MGAQDTARQSKSYIDFAWCRGTHYVGTFIPLVTPGRRSRVALSILGEKVEAFTSEDAAERFAKSERGKGCVMVREDGLGIIVFYRKVAQSIALDVREEVNSSEFHRSDPLLSR